jgi:hypothetical protein
MATRVLSSEAGKASITRVNGILNNGLEAQIQSLRTEGETLSDPNVWDGSLAENFRTNDWPAASLALKNCAETLAALHAKIQGINTDIMAAGGNA